MSMPHANTSRQPAPRRYYQGDDFVPSGYRGGSRTIAPIACAPCRNTLSPGDAGGGQRRAPAAVRPGRRAQYNPVRPPARGSRPSARRKDTARPPGAHATRDRQRAGQQPTRLLVAYRRAHLQRVKCKILSAAHPTSRRPGGTASHAAHLVAVTAIRVALPHKEARRIRKHRGVARCRTSTSIAGQPPFRSPDRARCGS